MNNDGMKAFNGLHGQFDENILGIMQTVEKKQCYYHSNGRNVQFLYLPESEFLDVTRTKVFRVFLLAIHRHLYKI